MAFASSQLTHNVVVPALPDGEPVIFRWHWPRKTFDRRMSALEIAAFVLPHMPSILPYLTDHPEIYANFAALLLRLTTWPSHSLDEVVPWIRRIEWCEEDEILELDLNAWYTPPRVIYG